MAKQKKNSNYVTEKTVAAKEKKLEEKRKAEKNKKIKLAAIWGGAVAGFVALVVLILFLAGAFDYTPTVTKHATVTLSDGSSFHVELYGEDAPKTVNNFVALCESGYFNGKSFLSLTDSALYMGDEKAESNKGVFGEFSSNGFDNKIPMKKGTLVMSRGEGNNSAYGQFFILEKKMTSLEGDYAAFGRLSDPSFIKELVSKCTIAADGKITNAPTIISITFHAESSH